MLRIPKGQIRPKISTMPRQQTEAAAYLDIYKLVIEKKRLRQELEGMDDRHQQIVDRLVILEQHITALEKTAHQVRDAEANSTNPATSANSPTPAWLPPVHKSAKLTNADFDTLFLNY
jgi:cell division septum initiation protein DivIVA